jgi:hypothetical protein
MESPEKKQSILWNCPLTSNGAGIFSRSLAAKRPQSLPCNVSGSSSLVQDAALSRR